MGQQDLYQSDFYEDKSRFADVFNGVLFGGKEVMKPEVSAKAILGILKVKIDLAKIVKKDKDGREVYDMCQAFEDYKEDGRKLGLKQGRKEGRREGKREGKREGELIALKKVVKNLMKNQKITFEEAVKLLGISPNKQKELETLI